MRECLFHTFPLPSSGWLSIFDVYGLSKDKLQILPSFSSGIFPVCVKVKVKSLSHVPLFVTPWTSAHQAPLSMEFSRPFLYKDTNTRAHLSDLVLTNYIGNDSIAR